MQEAMNINPIRQEHKNNRYAGVLPRDHDHEEQKKSFVGWDQDSSSAKDQGKNNMATERLTEKSMRKPGEDQSLVVKQEYLSNVERDTKPKTVVDNPTGYDPVLVGGDINQDDLLSKEKKKGGRSSSTTRPYSDPSKNVVDSVAGTSSPLEKEKKEMTAPMRTLGNEQIKDDGKTQLYTDPPKTTHASSTVGVQSKPESSIPLSRTQSRSENTTFKIISAIPSVEKEKKGILSNGTAGQYSDSPKMKATEEVPSTRIATEKNAKVSLTTQNGKKEADPYVAEKNIGVPFSGNDEADRARKKTSTNTGPYEKRKEKKKGFWDRCSIL